MQYKFYSDQRNASDAMLGNLLVLLQVDWPNEKPLAEAIFEQIASNGRFTFLNFSKYIICSDFIEEFMFVYMHGNDVQLEFAQPQASLGTRRIGTRGADKGVKDDFKQLVRKQIARCNDNIVNLIVQFVADERVALAQNMFDK